MKIFFITTVDPKENTGGSLVRRGTIEHLRECGFEVVVVKPGISEEQSKDVITTKPLGYSRMNYLLESFGFIKDRHISWVNNTRRLLLKHADASDIMFITTGGSMSPLLLGDRLKKDGYKVVVNYHDPTEFTTLEESYGRENTFYHVNRDKIEKKYIYSFDYIITSSEAYRQVLISKYPNLVNKISCNYFGYIKQCERYRNSDFSSDKLRIVYGGNFGPTQSPEILAEAADGLEGVEVIYVGNYQANNNILKYEHSSFVHLIPQMPADKYYEFLIKNADLGFFSLRNRLSKYCVPSKLYDFINLSIPMLAVVEGDAKKIIEDLEIGIVCQDDIMSLREAISRIKNRDVLNKFYSNILNIRDDWSMTARIKEVKFILDNINKVCGDE